MVARVITLLAVCGLLYICPARADSTYDPSFDDASQALDNLGDLTESVDRTGRTLNRVVQPGQEQFRWMGKDQGNSPWSQWRKPIDPDDQRGNSTPAR